MKRAIITALMAAMCITQAAGASTRTRSKPQSSARKSRAQRLPRWQCSNTSGTRSTMTDCERDHSRDVFNGEFGGYPRNPSGLTWNQIQALKQSLRDQSASSRSRSSAHGHY